MGNVTGFFHCGITVSDMDRAMSFYGNGLGLEMHVDRIIEAPYVKEVLGLPFDDIRAVYYRIPGGGFLEILEYHGIERLPAAARPCDPGSGHLCLYVDDLQAAYDQLVSLGFRARHDGVTDVTAGPNAGGRTTYFADPDGYSVELFQKPAQS